MLIENNYANAIKEIKSRVSAAFDDLKGFWKIFNDNQHNHEDPTLALKPIFFAQTKLQALLGYIKHCENDNESEEAKDA
jgi:hypothetical protein